MSEAKSLVVWRDFDGANLSENDRLGITSKIPQFWNFRAYEYAHDLTGRFLGVFREVRA